MSYAISLHVYFFSGIEKKWMVDSQFLPFHSTQTKTRYYRNDVVCMIHIPTHNYDHTNFEHELL